MTRLLRAKVLAASIAVFVGFLGKADAATFQRLPNVAAVRMTGEIQPGDAKAFKQFMRELDNRGIKIRTLSLNSPGGDLYTSLAIGEEVRSRGLRTVVGERAWCMSGCVTVFAFGVERVVYPDARLGVHSARGRKTDREDDGTMAATVHFARRMKELGTPYSVIGKILATPGENIAILDEKDIKAWNVKVVGERPYQPLNAIERLREFARPYLPPYWIDGQGLGFLILASIFVAYWALAVLLGRLRRLLSQRTLRPVTLELKESKS
jgi:hypothetical protein